MCPLYNELAQLFCNKQNSNVVTESISFDVDTEIEQYMTSVDTNSTSRASTPLTSDHISTSLTPLEASEASEVLCEPAPSQPSTSTSRPQHSLREKLKSRTPKNSLSELVEMQKRRDSFYQMRINIEQQKVDNEKQRLLYDQQKIELETKRLPQEFEIKKLEFEHKERLAELELKLKYNKE